MKPLSIGIAHASFLPERRASLERMLDHIDTESGIVEPHVSRSESREHASVWFMRLLRWAAQQEGHVVLLNDDVTLCEDFYGVVEAMIEAVPDEMFALHTTAPAANSLAAAAPAWLRSYWYTGPAGVFPPGAASRLLAWLETAGSWGDDNEDGMIMRWAWSEQRPIWHSVPALVKHDVGVPSTLGYDHHAMRCTEVFADGDTRRLQTPAEWKVESAPLLIECPWRPTSALEQRNATRGKARIAVATPTRGACAPEFVDTMIALARAGADAKNVEWSIVHRFRHGDSVVHSRSRIIREFLASNATHLFFVDDDVSFHPVVLSGMLGSGHDFVMTPYPKREGVDFKRVVEHAGEVPPEAVAYRYIKTFFVSEDGEAKFDERGCAEIGGYGLGCTLISRVCLEKMVAHYAARVDLATFARDASDIPDNMPLDGRSLRDAIYEKMLELAKRVHEASKNEVPIFDDEMPDGRVAKTLALCAMLDRSSKLLGEDISLCQRWREMGGRVMLYLGHGSPVNHHGTHAYKGHIEAFGVRRAER